jgi:putative flippase GtrA
MKRFSMFFRFLLVGALSSLLQFAVLAFCLEQMHFNCSLAVSLAYFASIILHYGLNRYFTFRMAGKPGLKELLRYLSFIGLNFGITVWVTTFFVEKLQIDAYIGTAFSIALTVFITFIVARRWIFTSTHAVPVAYDWIKPSRVPVLSDTK